MRRSLRGALRGQLEELRRTGYAVLEDLHVGPSRLSHCVVGPGGVFAIEPDEVAEPGGVVGEAHRVERLLHAAGVHRPVRAVVAVSAPASGESEAGVDLVPAWEVAAAVRSARPVLGQDEVDRIRAVLALYRRGRRSA